MWTRPQVAATLDHAALKANPAAPKVACPDYNRDIHSQIPYFTHPLGDIFSARWVNAKTIFAGQCFATHLQ